MKYLKRVFTIVCIIAILVSDLHIYSATTDSQGGVVLYQGEATASTAGTNLTFFYTKHVGGDWDASAINEDSYFYVEYEGVKNGVYLAFTSASGATPWVAVYADETGETEEGGYYSIFSYENFSEKFGTNFVRLDQIQAYASTNKKVTLKKILYFTGKGEAVDSSDGTWDRSDTGIAFVGDSIVQNPLVDTQHLKGIDWNGILERTDCVNYGIGGQTTKELVLRIDEVAKKKYDKVVFLCGINDIGRGFSNATIKKNYATMIDALNAENPDIEIYIISVLPTTDAFYTNMQSMISGLNVVLFGLCQEYENVTYVDCYSSFVGEDKYCKEGLTFDGLHPNLEGYSIIADILNPYLQEAEEDTELSDGIQSGKNGDILVWLEGLLILGVLLLVVYGIYKYIRIKKERNM